MAESTNPTQPSSEQVPPAPQQTNEKRETAPAASQPQSALSQIGGVLNKAGEQVRTGLDVQSKQAGKQAQTTMTERLWAGLSYIPMVALISLIMNPASDFVKLHAKQGLMLFLVLILTLFIDFIFSPLGLLLGILIKFATFIVGIYSIYMAFSGNWWKIPFIYQISDKLPVDLLTKVTTEAITGQTPNLQSQTPPPTNEKTAEPAQDATSARPREDSTPAGAPENQAPKNPQQNSTPASPPEDLTPAGPPPKDSTPSGTAS